MERWVVGQCRADRGDQFMFCLADVKCAEVNAALCPGDFLLIDVSLFTVEGR